MTPPMELNNREIAFALWICVVAAVMLAKSQDLRSAVGDFILGLFDWKLVLAFLLNAGYVAGIVWVLYKVGIWSPALLKETLIWYFFTAIVLAFSHSISKEGDEKILWRILVESVSIVVVVEFIISTYTLSLVGELFLIPVVTVVGFIAAVLQEKERTRILARMMELVLTIIGLAVLAFAISAAIDDLGNLWSIDTAKEIALVPMLSLLFMPFIYAFRLYVSHDSLLNLPRVGPSKSRSLRWYANRRILSTLGLSNRLVRQFHREHGYDLTQVRSRGDVDALLVGWDKR